MEHPAQGEAITQWGRAAQLAFVGQLWNASPAQGASGELFTLEAISADACASQHGTGRFERRRVRLEEAERPVHRQDAPTLPGDVAGGASRAPASSARHTARWGSPSALRGSLEHCRTDATETGGDGHGRGGIFAWDQWDWLARAENVAHARDQGRLFALTHGAGAGVIDDLLLAISEAASNVVLHAFVGATPGRLALVARAGRDRLTVSVIDDGIGMRPRLDSPGLGLGLSTIYRLVAGLEIRPGFDGRGTEVRMSFAAPGVAPRPAA